MTDSSEHARPGEERPSDAEGPAYIARLVMRFRTDLYAYLLAAVRNHHDAEDLLQEVSLAASRSWAQYRPGTDFRVWAREVARRRILDRAKKARRRPLFMDPGTLVLLEAAARAVESAQPVEPRRSALRECLPALEASARRVLELRYDAGLAVPRIADRIDKTVQATYAILKRVRQSLRECVERRLSRMDPQPGGEKP